MWLVEGSLGTEEEIGMKSVSEQVSQNKCAGWRGKTSDWDPCSEASMAGGKHDAAAEKVNSGEIRNL